MNPTEQAHQNLRNLLLNGRILINGLPPTANELGSIIQGEQMLFEKATKQDKAEQLAADKKKPKDPKEPKKPKGPKVIPIQDGQKGN